mmetsp:Transcript_96006/g.158363  ORF Transcript_96006/g.158363 Transcript_96006/m.158363 type:complete len:202 (-) Transcript_96006:8-613(-)
MAKSCELRSICASTQLSMLSSSDSKACSSEFLDKGAPSGEELAPSMVSRLDSVSCAAVNSSEEPEEKSRLLMHIEVCQSLLACSSLRAQTLASPALPNLNDSSFEIPKGGAIDTTSRRSSTTAPLNKRRSSTCVGLFPNKSTSPRSVTWHMDSPSIDDTAPLITQQRAELALKGCASRSDTGAMMVDSDFTPRRLRKAPCI